MLDILFIHPNSAKKIYQDLAKNNAAIEPPIWCAMLANSIRAYGASVKIIDAEVENLSHEELAENVSILQPKIVCMVVYGQQPSASSQNMFGAVKSADIIKSINKNQFIVFVGGHVAALPVETLKRENSIDAVCSNEGVYTLRELSKIERFKDIYLRKVQGLVFRNEDGLIEKNVAAKIVPKNLLTEHLPGMAWDLLPSLKKYRTAGWHSWSNDSEKQPFGALYTSLGCPYKCSFCMINIINRENLDDSITSQDSNKFRWWPPEFIINDFEHLANEGVKNIKIADELFVLNPNHFIKICDLIIERGYNFNIWAYSRIDTCKPEYLEKLYKAGVKWLGLGIENPNNDIRSVIHKSGFQETSVVDQIKMIQSYNINVGGNYIFGLPQDTLSSMQETLDFAMSNLTEMVNFYCAMAYPGSPLYLDSKIMGKTLPEEYSAFSQHSYDTLNLSNDKLTSAQILKFRDDAWMKYHNNSDYLNLLERKFGKNCLKNINQTKSIKLKRKLLGD